MKTATNERFRINAAGNIKVQDNVQLQFGGTAYTSDSEFQIYYSSLENHVGLTTHPLIISSTGGERLRINTSGFVGINSAIPRTNLQVTKGSSHYNPGNPTAFNSNNVLACFENSDDVEVTLLSPNNKKNIINFGDNDNVANSSIEYDHSVNHLIFKVNGGSERLRINNSGAFGLAGQNYGTSGQVLKSGGTNGVPTWGEAGNFTSYAIIAEVRSGTSDAGTLTANTWMTRAINTEIADPDGIVSISSNQFTLQAGTYLIEWSAPAWRCDRHTTRLYDVTNSAARGNATLEFSQDSGSYTQSSSRGFARVTISGATVYKLETKGNVTKSGDGLGIDPNNLASCIYAMAKIYKES